MQTLSCFLNYKGLDKSLIDVVDNSVLDKLKLFYKIKNFHSTFKLKRKFLNILEY